MNELSDPRPRFSKRFIPYEQKVVPFSDWQTPALADGKLESVEDFNSVDGLPESEWKYFVADYNSAECADAFFSATAVTLKPLRTGIGIERAISGDLSITHFRRLPDESPKPSIQEERLRSFGSRDQADLVDVITKLRGLTIDA